jgi:hypothetical protein
VERDNNRARAAAVDRQAASVREAVMACTPGKQRCALAVPDYGAG